MNAGTQTPEGWQGLLVTGETILWQGRPDPAFHWVRRPLPEMLIGGFFVLFSTVWMLLAAQGGGIFWMFGLIFFFTGLYNAGGNQVWRHFMRRHTFYTLTTRRAFIATDPFGMRGLKDYHIRADTPLEFDGQVPGTITFHTEHVATKNGSRTEKIGFERIDTPHAVFDLFRDVQRGQS